MAKYLVLRERKDYITNGLENALNSGYSIVTVNSIGDGCLQYVLKKETKTELSLLPNDRPKCQHDWLYIGCDEYRCTKCGARS